MKTIDFLIVFLMVLSVVLIYSNILYGLSLYIVPLIIYSFILTLFWIQSLNSEHVEELKSDILIIGSITLLSWLSIGFLIGFGINVMIILPIQYATILAYKFAQIASVEVLRRLLLNRFVGIGFSSLKIIAISILGILPLITYGKIINFNVSYFPEFITLFMNSLVLSIIGYFYNFRSQLILSMLNSCLFSLSPILINVSGAIKYMLDAFIIFTQFTIVYYINYTDHKQSIKQELILSDRYRKLMISFFKILAKTTFIIAILVMISFLIGFRGLAIVSNSMNPVMDRGDIAFININDHNIRKGDIIAFSIGDKVIIHRVYRVDDKTHAILTKGDANKNIDPWIVTGKNYVGKYVFSLPLIGYPSIILSSLFTNPVISISLTVTLILAFLIIIHTKEMVRIN